MCSSDLLEVCLSAFLGNFGELMIDPQKRSAMAQPARKRL